MNFFIILILLLLLIVAAYYDCKHYRISNAMVGSGALVGVSLNALLPDGIGFSNALLGLGTGLIAMMPFYIVRIMGAGDVKLVAMVGAFIGPSLLIPTLFYIIISGGTLALFVMQRRGKLRHFYKKFRINFYQWFRKSSTPTNLQLSKATDNMGRQESDNHILNERLPYGIAIAAGTALCLLEKNFAVF